MSRTGIECEIQDIETDPSQNIEDSDEDKDENEDPVPKQTSMLSHDEMQAAWDAAIAEGKSPPEMIEGYHY